VTERSEEHKRNQGKASKYLERFQQTPLPHFINGKSDHSGDNTIENINPTDNSQLNLMLLGDTAIVDRAVVAAHEAFPKWQAMPGTERKHILHRAADLIESRGEEIALIESVDTGQPIRFMKKAALRAAENFRFFADRAPDARDGVSLPAGHHFNYTLRQPIGPVAIITPWNTPFMLSTWKIAPALAAGCTVVHKPAEWSPLTATLLAEILLEAGVPPGVANLVNGIGEEAGRSLTEHSAIKAIAFVGESSTGSQIMRQGAETLKRVHFELGGKNPVIVFEDADLDRAADAVMFMIYSLNGERCTSSSRLLVQRSIHDAFVARLRECIKRIKIGDPLDPATELGPLIHQTHWEKVQSYVTLAKKEGAKVQQSSTKLPNEGNFIAPTLFTEARNNMRIAREEIFGPVLTVVSFDDEDQALQIANDTPYGLAGYVWTSNVTRGHRLAQRLDAGMIWVNSENVRHLPAPFGGFKASGIGRDGGDYSFDFYMETKNVCVALGNHAIPKLGS